MIKNKIILLIISLSLFMPYTIYADCTKEEIDNFKKIEDEYKVTYEFDKETKLYTLNLVNPDFDHYVYNNDIFMDDKINISIVENNIIKIDGVIPKKYEFIITGTNDNCTNTLKTINIELPKYNNYSEDPLCEGIEEFVLCQQTYDKDIDYDTFVSRVELYKKNLKTKTDNSVEENEVKEESKIVTYIKDNIFQIIIIIIFITMVIITIILTAKSIRKSRRLE